MNAERLADGLEPQSLGSTELGRIIAASWELIDGTTLQIPTTGFHTMAESAPLASVAAFIEVLSALSSQ